MAASIQLHIGTEKTGTTSIQSFLADNRLALRTRGFLFPAVPGRSNHIGLAAYAQADHVFDDVRITRGVRDAATLEDFRAAFERDLVAELHKTSAEPAPETTIVFSNEHCSSRLRSVSEIARLKQLCDRLAPQTTVVVYLRNQVDLLASWYSTSVKSGSSRRLRWPPGPNVAHMLDYQAMLDRWAAVFGRDRIQVRRFVTADFAGGDLIADFAASIGLDAEGLKLPQRVNESLDTDCLAFLREFNRHVPRIERGQINPMRGHIVQMLERISNGPTFVVSQYVANQIADAYADSNAAVARDFFGGRYDPLFPPAKAVGDATYLGEPPMDAAAFARIAAHIWCTDLDRIRKLETDLRDCRQARPPAGIDAGQDTATAPLI